MMECDCTDYSYTVRDGAQHIVQFQYKQRAAWVGSGGALFATEPDWTPNGRRWGHIPGRSRTCPGPFKHGTLILKKQDVYISQERDNRARHEFCAVLSQHRHVRSGRTHGGCIHAGTIQPARIHPQSRHAHVGTNARTVGGTGHHHRVSGQTAPAPQAQAGAPSVSPDGRMLHLFGPRARTGHHTPLWARVPPHLCVCHTDHVHARE